MKRKGSSIKKAAWYANELISGKIFCHYQGKSEIGLVHWEQDQLLLML